MRCRPRLHRFVIAVLAVSLTAACAGAPRLGERVEDAVAAGPGRDSVDYRHPSPDRAESIAVLVRQLLEGEDDPEVPERLALDRARDRNGREIAVVT